MTSLELVCPGCRLPLPATDDGGACEGCGHPRFRLASGAPSFVPLPEAAHERIDLAEHRANFEREAEGIRRRMERFLWPLLVERLGRAPARVLDVGCGGGAAVRWLAERGVEAWGVDPIELRLLQWEEEPLRPETRIGADGGALPFSDCSFDAIVSSGTLEHVGVEEAISPRYRVRPLPDRDQRRARFLAELLRVLVPGGIAIVDFPNGAFPIDVWHGDRPGQLRWHSPRERFLPTWRELVRHLAATGRPGAAAAVSPRGRFAFEQVAGGSRLGRIAVPFARVLLAAADRPGLRFLARSPLNPYIVAVITAERGRT